MGTVINALCCGANVALYAAWGYWFNLAAAVVCGLLCIAAAMVEAS